MLVLLAISTHISVLLRIHAKHTVGLWCLYYLSEGKVQLETDSYDGSVKNISPKKMTSFPVSNNHIECPSKVPKRKPDSQMYLERSTERCSENKMQPAKTDKVL